MEDQIGALGLVLNALVLFNTRCMDAAIARLHNEAFVDNADREKARAKRRAHNRLGFAVQLIDGGRHSPGSFALRLGLTTSSRDYGLPKA